MNHYGWKIFKNVKGIDLVFLISILEPTNEPKTLQLINPKTERTQDLIWGT